MLPPVPTINEAYREYADLELRRHDLLTYGGETEAALDDIEDRLTELWGGLDEAQRASLKGIGSDLNWVRRRGQPPPKGREPDDVQQGDVDALAAAQAAQDWHRILHFLRVCTPVLEPGVIAYSRATCYHRLGLFHVTVPFADLTIELVRDDSGIARNAFDGLMRLNPGIAFHRANLVLGEPTAYPPVLVPLSVGFVLDFLGGANVAVDGAVLVTKLKEARPRMDAKPTDPSDRVAFYLVGGNILNAFGEGRDAAEYFEEVLKQEPENHAALTGLGVAVYEADMDKAAELFRKAILAKTSYVRPYIYLANYHLRRREFQLAFGYAKQAEKMTKERAALAAIYEYMALSANELGFADDVVLDLFSRAAKLDPHSERLATNLSRFKEYMAGLQPKRDPSDTADQDVIPINERTVMPSSLDVALAGAFAQ